MRWRAVAVVALVGIAALALPAPTASARTAASCPTTVATVTDEQRQAVWDLAARRLPALSGPSTYPFGATGDSGYVRTSAYAWTSGFYPASLWLLYGHTHDSRWLQLARTYTVGVLPVARWTGTHDLGFMVGRPAELGMRLDPATRRTDAYADALLRAADSLSSRWSVRVRAIRSGTYAGRWGLIIDSAMNAPMLMLAGLVRGGGQGRRLAARGLQHMLTLSRYFIRPDGSTRHRLTFDPRTGQPAGAVPGQGLSTDSTWARGQAWAIHGFADAYSVGHDQRMLDAARSTAEYWISKVPAGCVPAWDLDVTDAAEPTDSSAAAITVAGLLHLADLEPDAARAQRYRQYALTTLGTLASDAWLDKAGTARGLLQGQSYNVPADSREGTYAWGDSYLLEALSTTG